jgi:hypothetical protein
LFDGIGHIAAARDSLRQVPKADHIRSAFIRGNSGRV